MSDPHAENRGRLTETGWWYCDCPLKWEPARRRCSRCKVLRPLKGSQLYEATEEFGGGHMPNHYIRPVKTK